MPKQKGNKAAIKKYAAAMDKFCDTRLEALNAEVEADCLVEDIRFLFRVDDLGEESYVPPPYTSDSENMTGSGKKLTIFKSLLD